MEVISESRKRNANDRKIEDLMMDQGNGCGETRVPVRHSKIARAAMKVRQVAGGGGVEV